MRVTIDPGLVWPPGRVRWGQATPIWQRARGIRLSVRVEGLLCAVVCTSAGDVLGLCDWVVEVDRQPMRLKMLVGSAAWAPVAEIDRERLDALLVEMMIDPVVSAEVTALSARRVEKTSVGREVLSAHHGALASPGRAWIDLSRIYFREPGTPTRENPLGIDLDGVVPGLILGYERTKQGEAMVEVNFDVGYGDGRVERLRRQLIADYAVIPRFVDAPLLGQRRHR